VRRCSPTNAALVLSPRLTGHGRRDRKVAATIKDTLSVGALGGRCGGCCARLIRAAVASTGVDSIGKRHLAWLLAFELIIRWLSIGTPLSATLRDVTTVLAVLALIVSLVAAFYTGMQGRASVRSADAAEGSLHAADRAADAAKDSAETARVLAVVEMHRLHSEYRPDLSDGRFEAVHNPRTGQYCSFYVFTLPRGYRIRGVGVGNGGGRSDLSLDPTLYAPAGHEVHAFVGDLKGLKDEDIRAMPRRLNFRFWPPQDGDSGEHWMCPCGADVIDGGGNGAGHWEHSVKVQLPPGVDALVPPMRVYGAGPGSAGQVR
jgi:hypothetical protein